MHELKGVITGLGTDPNRSAKLQLDARVDKFGSARIRGEVSVLQPEKLTEIDMAFRNLLGSLVTAPFRALGALFGGGDKEIDTIVFEPGAATLAPPEQQKIETVARALKERPNLMLKVAPVYSTQHDTPVLQSLAVRSDIAVRMGLEVSPGEDPGPIDAANPRVAPAVEAAFSARYAPAVLQALKQRAVSRPDATASPASQAGASEAVPTADPKEAGTDTSATTAPAATGQPAKPAKPPPAFYQGLIDRMVAEHTVTEPMLAQLAARRAAAVVEALTGEGGVAPARVVTGEAHDAAQATNTVVPLKLELDVAK